MRVSIHLPRFRMEHWHFMCMLSKQASNVRLNSVLSDVATSQDLTNLQNNESELRDSAVFGWFDVSDDCLISYVSSTPVTRHNIEN